jgi:hypothetical protein
MKPSLTVLFATFLLILIATTTGADVANPEPKASPKPPQIVLNTRLALEPDRPAPDLNPFPIPKHEQFLLVCRCSWLCRLVVSCSRAQLLIEVKRQQQEF